MPASFSRYLGSFVAIFIGCALWALASNAAAQTACNMYESGQSAPSGYGAAWDVLTSARELLLVSQCSGSAGQTTTYVVGAGKQNQYVYNRGYLYAGGAWQPFVFSGTFAQGSSVWLVGRGTYINSSPPSADHYWVGYVCSWTGAQWKCGCRDSTCSQGLWQLQGVTYTASGGSGNSGGTVAGSCLSNFSGSITRLDRSFDFQTHKYPSWNNGARFDLRGGVWKSLMNDDDRNNTAPLQFGVDWGTNIGSGRRDIYDPKYDTRPQTTDLCVHGGLVRGTQPETATWWDVKHEGVGEGGYAITFNTEGRAVIEYMRIHNHEDAFTPYKSTNFVIQDNWVSYTRDDCIENDAYGAGVIRNNLFDSCTVFYSAINNLQNGPVSSTGKNGTIRIENNLILMGNQAGAHGSDKPSQYGYQPFFKTRGWDTDRLPKLVMKNNVIAFEVPDWYDTSKNWHPTDIKPNGMNITECSNNTILWFGNGSFPGEIGGGLGKCMKVITGKAARDQWEELKQEWIDDHPSIQRL